MSTTVVVAGQTYEVPEFGEQGWAEDVSALLIALGNNVLFIDGSTQTQHPLTADANFGPNNGLIAKYYTSRGTNPAVSGEVRLANTDSIAWRNAANTADLLLTLASDVLFFGGVVVATASNTVTFTNKSIDAANNPISNLTVSTFASAAVNDDPALAGATDDQFPTALATRTAIDTTAAGGAAKVDKTTQIIAGSGLTGGGDLSTSRTLDVNPDNVTVEVVADAVQLKDDGITNAKINSAAGIVDTKLATINTPGKVSNSATSATDVGTPSTIVARDSSGDFSANEITVFSSTANTLDVGTNIIANSSTGCDSFAGMTGIGGATFTVGAGTGVIVDPSTNYFRRVTWTAVAGQSPAIATGVSYVYMQATGIPLITTTPPTPTSVRQNILLGRVVASAGTIGAITNQVVPILHPNNLVYDLTQAMGVFQKDMIRISANGANLSLDKTSGTLFQTGSHFVTDPNDPSYVPITGATLFNFLRLTQTSTVGTFNTIDPTNYDNAGVVTAVPSANDATIMRVYQGISGLVAIQYGQVVYSNLALAIQSVSTEAFVTNTSLPGNAVLIASICVTKSCTSLLDTTTSRIFLASRFGDAGSGAAGSSASTMQNTYNNSTSPEIITDSTRGAVTVKRGSAADTDAVLEVQNAAGTVTWSVTGAGNMIVTSLSTHYATTWALADGATKVVTHNLASTDVIVQMYDMATGESIFPQVVRTNTNTVTLTASEAPNASGWRVLVIRIIP